MKITKSKLKQLIREELQNLNENSPVGTDEEIANELVSGPRGIYKPSQLEAVLAAVREMDPSFKTKMSDVRKHIKVGY